MGTAQVQGDLWGARAREWADLQEVMFAPFYEAAFDAAGVAQGTVLLDVGCGAGLALTLADKRGAHVSGLDAAAGLVEIAQSQPGVFGAKLTGGGWGGCAVIIHAPRVRDALSAALTAGYQERFGREVHLLPTVAAQGADAVRFT